MVVMLKKGNYFKELQKIDGVIQFACGNLLLAD